MDISGAIKKEINYLNAYLQANKFNVNSIRIMENSGEFAFIIKFPQFNEFDTTLTLQVPGK